MPLKFQRFLCIHFIDFSEYFVFQPLSFEVIKGRLPGVDGYLGDYVGINSSRMLRQGADGKSEMCVARAIRNRHDSELFPSIVAVQCMDGGKFHQAIMDGDMSDKDFQAEWKKSNDRVMDFGNTGKCLCCQPPYDFYLLPSEINVLCCSCLSVAVSVHLISRDGKWMLWGTEKEMTNIDFKSQAFFEKFIMPDFKSYKEYAVAAIYNMGMIGGFAHHDY